MRSTLLGAIGAVALAMAGAGLFLQPQAAFAQDANAGLPMPPDMPRLASGPDYEHCLSLLRTDPEAARVFADAWEATGGGEGARHCAALGLLGIGQPEQAARRLEDIAHRSRGTTAARASVLGQAAQAWLLAGDAGRAFGATTMALGLTPDDTDLLVDRSIALGTLGRYSEAMQDLDRVLQLEPDRAEAWVFRAAAARHIDRIDQAQADVARALELTPDNAEALLERGIIRQMLGDGRGARQDWERAIAAAPDSPAADLAQQNIALNEAGPQRR